MGDLARRTATAQSSVSEVVARLARKGLVVRARSIDDHRRVEISLSDAGRGLLARAPETIQERLLAAFARLTSDRQRQAADALQAWISEAGLGGIAATMFFEPTRDK
jgi:DNA-binding MarR family transcriptional regulator